MAIARFSAVWKFSDLMTGRIGEPRQFRQDPGQGHQCDGDAGAAEDHVAQGHAAGFRRAAQRGHDRA